MPHSTKGSTGSYQTFDLSSQDRPMTPHSTSRPNSSYGVALTSPTMNDERTSLPSQKDTMAALRRKSSPGNPAEVYAYADLIKSSGNIDQVVKQSAGDRRSYSYNEAAKRKTQYYEEQFQYKDNAAGGVRERAIRQSPVIAELKTNVIVKDEFTLVTDLSYHLAQRYTRPDSAIMIRVDHSACLALGGTFDPCYMLTINAVPSQTGPSTNKRNSNLIQSFMAEILSVPPERGIVTFVPIPEENLAMSGNTILGEMEKLEKQDPGATKKLIQDAHRKSQTFNKKSMPSMNGDANGTTTTTTTSTSSSEKGQAAPPVVAATNHVVELPASESTRPSTANGAFAAENGLRMNGISTEELTGKDSKLPNGRPKTFGAPPSTSSSSIPQQAVKEPISARQSVRRTSTAESQPQPQPKPSLKPTPTQIKNSTPRATTMNHVPQAPRPVSNLQTSSKPPTQRSTTAPAPPPEPRPKNTYLDNVSNLTSTKEPSASEAAKKKDAANTAKRRSTITATPKMPPVPPSEKEKEDTKSMSSKLSKRKSFFKEVFRRERTPAWYKQ